MRKVLKFVREGLANIEVDGDYAQGYVDALLLIQEFIVDELWERGEEA